MKTLLFQLDGKLPNVALMRIAAHHRALGHAVELRTGKPDRELWDTPDFVYGSSIFSKSFQRVNELKSAFPSAIIGGTGVDIKSSLEFHGITTTSQDYSIYPKELRSIGFTQRGCRLRCSFCVVPKKEGAIRQEQTIAELWRGDPYPKQLLLLDNDFFGQAQWRERIAEILDGGFRVCFCQGINARFLTDEAAEACAAVNYRDDSMQTKRIYAAWDNLKDEATLFAGLSRLVKYGVKPAHIMVYMLVGYWSWETLGDRLYRLRKLQEFGAMPYPIPYTRTPELVGFQRWVIGNYYKRTTWPSWERANYRPENL